MSIDTLLDGKTSLDAFVAKLGPKLELLHELKGTPQDPQWHAEGDVHVHTNMVLDALYPLLEQHNVQGDRRKALILAAVFHDIAKPITTRHVEMDGVTRITSPRHADKGRSYLAYRLRSLALSWNVVDMVLALVGHHHDPKQLVVRNSPSRVYRRLARLCDLELLYLLEMADITGRICEDKDQQLEHVEMFREFATEYQWYGNQNPYADVDEITVELNENARPFVRGEAIRGLESGLITMPAEELARSYGYRDSFSHLVVLCGPSGSGKTTWIDSNAADYDVVNLDSIRGELTGDPADQSKNGTVRQLSKERLKESLRAHRNVVWDASNLRRDFRSLPIQLGYDYKAFVTLVVFQTTLSEVLSRNKSRARQVPEEAIRRQIETAEFPYLDEACEVIITRPED